VEKHRYATPVSRFDLIRSRGSEAFEASTRADVRAGFQALITAAAGDNDPKCSGFPDAPLARESESDAAAPDRAR
jgi:hypothetical protein